MPLFICPLCQSPLQPATDTWRCDGSLNPKQISHPFDVARQGYINLLPVQQKKSKAPGDSQASIEARQRFLQAGHYQPLQAVIYQKIQKLLTLYESNTQDKASIRWLDIGCGEGYYTQAIAQTGMNMLIAADISKPAVTRLARDTKAANQLWYQQDESITVSDKAISDQAISKNAMNKGAAIYPLVANAAQLPLRPHSMMGISSLFSPILPEVFAHTLQKRGYLVIAKPDAGHLASMRTALFDSVREHDSDKFLPGLAPYFELIETQYINTKMSLSAPDLADLLTMTPYSYRARREKREALLAKAELQPFITEAKFVVYILQKTTVH